MDKLEERKCPLCGREYPHPTQYCIEDGQELQVIKTLVGKIVGNYRLDSVLGVGSMAAVYRASNIYIPVQYEVKVLHPEMVRKEGMRERFRREALTARRIQHPNAVQVTDFGEADSSVIEEKLLYLVKEFVEGNLLREILDKEKKIAYWRAVEILSQVCEILEAAHRQDIIHRDLKPENLIVQRLEGKEIVKVLDFGIAKLREVEQEGTEQPPQTKVGILVGTPQYMSPEQYKGRGRELSPSSDVYSLGVVAYEMLCGRLPFPDEISRHLNEPPPPLRIFEPSVPERIERVILRALAKNPAERQQSAAEFAHDLQEAASESAPDQTVLALPTTHTASQAFTWKDKLKLITVRLARWAGWLYFVDQDLLDNYIDYQMQRVSKWAALD